MVAKFTISGYIGEYDEQMEALLSGTGVSSQGEGEYTSAAMLRAFFEKEAPEAESYEITFKSPGGDVAEGFEMYDLIRAQSKPVTAIGFEVQSVATIPFLACNDRKMVRGGTFMIHNAWIDPRSLGNIQLNVQNLDQIKKVAQNATDKLLAVYLNRSGHGAIDRIKSLMEQEATLGTGELQSLGFVTEIIDGQAAKPARALAFDKSVFAIQDGPIVTYADVIGFINGKVLMIQRDLNDSFEGGKWAFPGGKVMQGETIEAGAVRELAEETGYSVSSIRKVAEIVNEDESTSHYFAAELNGTPSGSAEIASIKLITSEEVASLDVIFGQNERYEKLISQAMSDERLSGIERALKGLKALLNLSAKAMVLQVPNGPQLYIFSEDGEFAGKKAVIAENGEPTETPAPAGTHAIEDGREIVVGEGGIISEVREAAAEGMSEEEMQAAVAAEKEKMQAAFEEEKAAMVQEKEQAINALKAEFTEKLQALESEVKVLASEVPGDGKKNEGKEAEDFAKLTPVQRILRVQAKTNN
jgi:8-oxo-dGTP pyrophosphatase MutT (NUDIX family)/ATP-dependent protease ClpP protease subunit